MGSEDGCYYLKDPTFQAFLTNLGGKALNAVVPPELLLQKGVVLPESVNGHNAKMELVLVPPILCNRAVLGIADKPGVVSR